MQNRLDYESRRQIGREELKRFQDSLGQQSFLRIHNESRVVGFSIGAVGGAVLAAAAYATTRALSLPENIVAETVTVAFTAGYLISGFVAAGKVKRVLAERLLRREEEGQPATYGSSERKRQAGL